VNMLHFYNEISQKISCPHCNGTNLGKAGKSAKGEQRYFCKNDDCETHTFMLEYCYKACEVGIKENIIDMATNASGIRDTARVLGINKNTVISQLKKRKVAWFKSIKTFNS